MNFPDILVLGATGRIGAVLRHFWPLAQKETSVLWQSRRKIPVQGLNWTIFDPLSDSAALARAARGRSAILCLSGVVPGRGNADAALEHNITLAEAALTAGARSGARVILASSAAVYGNQAGLLAENTPLRPISDYGRAKARMEQSAARAQARTGVTACCLRIGNIAGLDSVLGGWRPGFQLDQFADGRCPARSYIGVATLARVLGDLLRAPRLPPVLNVAAPGLTDMGALLTAAGLPWTPRTPGPDVIPQVQLDTSALEQLSPSDANGSDPNELVAQWRILERDPKSGNRFSGQIARKTKE